MSYRDDVMQTQPQTRLCETLEIAARADAEIAALRAEVDELRGAIESLLHACPPHVVAHAIDAARGEAG